MSPTIEITEEVYSRLEKHVVGFDNPSSVIIRLLDSFEGQQLTQINELNFSHQSTSTNNGRLFSNKEVQQRVTAIAKSLPENELEELCNDSSSKDIFGISFPLFIRINASANQAEKKQAVKYGELALKKLEIVAEMLKSGFYTPNEFFGHISSLEKVLEKISLLESMIEENKINHF